MLIITLVIFFVVANTVYTEKINESTLFQRLTTLLIYQERKVILRIWIKHQSLRRKLSYFSLISDTKGIPFIKVIFHFNFCGQVVAWCRKTDFYTAIITNRKHHNFTRRFSGNKGKHHDTYFVIPATIMTANDTVYHGTFFIRQLAWRIFYKDTPIYLLIWLWLVSLLSY